MNERELENWQKIEHHLRQQGLTDCMFFKRAVAINSGKPDPLEEPFKQSKIEE